MSLMDRIRSASKIKIASTLEEADILTNADCVQTPIPALNIAFTGSINGGLTPGLTMFCGESKCFKSLFALICAKAYLDKYEDGVLLFYDAEGGASRQYFDALNIDMKRVWYSAIKNVEELKFDIMTQLEQFERGDHVVIVVDSVGQLASKKEIEDALDEKAVADMSRAKSMKSLTRMIVPHLNIKNIPMIVINHVYKEIGLFPRDIPGGGSGWVYGSNQIFIITRSQEKNGTDIVGWNFTLSVMKSRCLKEKQKFPVTVTYDGGICKWSALLDIAIDGGFVHKPSNGWYQRVDSDGVIEDKKWRAKDTNSNKFWQPIIANPKFDEFVQKKYLLTTTDTQLISDEPVETEEEPVETEE